MIPYYFLADYSYVTQACLELSLPASTFWSHVCCHCTLFISLLLNLGIKQLLFYVFIFWCICEYLCGGQRRVPVFPFYHSLPYSFKTGPLTEPRARLVTNKSWESSCLCTTALGLQEYMATPRSLSRCWDLNLYLQSRFSNPLRKAFEILRFCFCCFRLFWTLYVATDDLEFLIFLTPPHKCWNHTCVPDLAEPRTLCMLHYSFRAGSLPEPRASDRLTRLEVIKLPITLLPLSPLELKF